MAETPDFFREFGIIPFGVAPPASNVRAFFSRGRVFGQYTATAIFSFLGLNLPGCFWIVLPAGVNWLASAAALLLVGFFIYKATCNDYQ